MEFLFAAISLGFLGGFHCIGMCGPIAVALPVHNKSKSEKIAAILTYNVGRIITYSLFGLLFGLIGQSFALFGLQQKLSVCLGLLILIGLFIPKRASSTSIVGRRFYSLLNKLKNKIAQQFQKNGIRSFFSIGLLNGLLPCGLIYMALTGATATGSVIKGIAFMATFGAGTLPFMFTVSYTSHLINVKARSVIRKTIPVFIGVMALLLILRGLNLGIPYLSPKLVEEKTTTSTACQKMSCCHKK